MSSNSYGDTCPNCGGNMDCYSDNKPFLRESGQCLNCGFYYMTVPGFLNLKELNELRIEEEIKPIDKKDMPKQDENLLTY